MRPVQQTTALIACLLVYLTTVSIAYLLGDYRPAVSGLLVVIFLSAFMQGRFSTLLVGASSMITMTLLILVIEVEPTTMGNKILDQFYPFLVLALTTGLVLYLKKVLQNFNAERTHIDSLFENATEGILLTNRQGHIILINPAAERIFGYSAAELVGESVDVLLPVRFHGHHSQLRGQFHSQPTNRGMGGGRDLFARRKDGSEFPVEVSLSHYDRENQAFVIAFIIDVTERKRAEQELKQINERMQRLNVELELKVEERTHILQEALQQVERSQAELLKSLDREREASQIKSRFVSMASHEFRTPLTTILTSATLASSYSKETQLENREKHLNRIRDSVGHLNELLEDFLALGRLEEGKLQVEVSAIDLDDFLTDLVEEMNLQLHQDQRIQVEFSGPPSFSTDKRLLKNILLNLLSNAIKFSPPEGKIELILKDGLNGKSISVRDQGMGIPPEDLPHLFTNFSRAANAINIPGTGLGLALVKRYAELMGGTVRLQSELGKGTVVTVELPPLDF